MKMSFYLVSRYDPAGTFVDWSDLEWRYLGVERFFDRLGLLCRPFPLNPVRLPLTLLFEERRPGWTAAVAARGRHLVYEIPQTPPIGDFDPARLGQGLDDLVAWRARTGRRGTDLRVAWRVEGDSFRVDWDEPQDPDFRATDESKGQGAADSRGADTLNCLALPFITRVTSLHGGTVILATQPVWRLSMTWPVDVRPTPRAAT
jgi:hypothetical protein